MWLAYSIHALVKVGVGVQLRWEAAPSFGHSMCGSPWGVARLSSDRECPEVWPSRGGLCPCQAARGLLLSPALHHENLVLRKDVKKPVPPMECLWRWLRVRARESILKRPGTFKHRKGGLDIKASGSLQDSGKLVLL